MSEKISQAMPEPEDALDLLVPGNRERVRILFRISEELEKESDRGCALVAAAYLENEIAQLLSKSFIKQGAKERDALFDFNGPIGTFSSKIKMGGALGLLPQEIQSALDVIRKIRNEFAHLHEPLNFESTKIKSRVLNVLPTLTVPQQNTRDAFVMKVQSIAMTIHFAMSHTAPRPEPTYEQIPICEDPAEQEIEIAARYMMKMTSPDITYEQALAMVRTCKAITYLQE